MHGQRSPHRKAIAAVAVFDALTAAFGVWGLASGVLSLGGLEDRLPWQNPVVGAVALGLVVAVPNAALAVLAVRGDARTGPAAIATGGLLIGWIVVELAFIRELSFFHPLYAAIGLLLVWLGMRAGPRLRWPADHIRPKGTRDRRQVLPRP